MQLVAFVSLAVEFKTAASSNHHVGYMSMKLQNRRRLVHVVNTVTSSYVTKRFLLQKRTSSQRCERVGLRCDVFSVVEVSCTKFPEPLSSLPMSDHTEIMSV